jgi:hypothetical protein
MRITLVPHTFAGRPLYADMFHSSGIPHACKEGQQTWAQYAEEQGHPEPRREREQQDGSPEETRPEHDTTEGKTPAHPTGFERKDEGANRSGSITPAELDWVDMKSLIRTQAAPENRRKPA